VGMHGHVRYLTCS